MQSQVKKAGGCRAMGGGGLRWEVTQFVGASFGHAHHFTLAGISYHPQFDPLGALQSPKMP